MKRGLVLAALLLTAACAGQTGNPRGAGPAPRTTAVSPSPSAAPAASPTPEPTSSQPLPPIAFTCPASVPEEDSLALVTLIGSDRTVVRDVSNPAHGRTLCIFAAHLEGARFANVNQVGYSVEGAHDTYIYVANLDTRKSALVATVAPGVVGDVAWSSDGSSFSYVVPGISNTVEWHAVDRGVDRLLTTLSLPPKILDTSPDQDDFYLSFSGSGYLALLQRSAIDPGGAQYAGVYVTDVDGYRHFYLKDVTMATWAGPGLYFFDNAAGFVRVWGVQGVFQGQDQLGGMEIPEPWIRPASSPDGRYIVYTGQLDGGVHHAWLLDLHSLDSHRISAGGRIGAMFLSKGLIWYAEESPCPTTCGKGAPPRTGKTFIYELASKMEYRSVITYLYDTWPHLGVGRRAYGQ